ncbi:hypothetical protein AVL48_27185 [Amycolatopsis regifaucium]|uniref:Tyr recombinase domain-containing protein n=1 Tax=Amycolatopsis regifaucium TaxID=546365 RepID=A0A154MPN5_9PSEU|nr:hypothetical protein AVL48_27185 [Amycolatopsis regifaucium]OKA03147.1 hypothetical protein ATP06_0237725 [Amycolatopsis regifaucium]
MEVLRHSGVRVEELVELAHTSIRQYQRPNGEVIALLVITPSKTDRERVIPMSAELFHVIAMIVMRQTAHGPIPSIPRYDGHERVWTAPMPFLFQRQIGGVRKVTSTATILNNLRKQCQSLGETNPAFRGLHFTPHDFRRLLATLCCGFAILPGLAARRRDIRSSAIADVRPVTSRRVGHRRSPSRAACRSGFECSLSTLQRPNLTIVQE